MPRLQRQRVPRFSFLTLLFVLQAAVLVPEVAQANSWMYRQQQQQQQQQQMLRQQQQMQRQQQEQMRRQQEQMRRQQEQARRQQQVQREQMQRMQQQRQQQMAEQRRKQEEQRLRLNKQRQDQERHNKKRREEQEKLTKEARLLKEKRDEDSRFREREDRLKRLHQQKIYKEEDRHRTEKYTETIAAKNTMKWTQQAEKARVANAALLKQQGAQGAQQQASFAQKKRDFLEYEAQRGETMDRFKQIRESQGALFHSDVKGQMEAQKQLSEETRKRLQQNFRKFSGDSCSTQCSFRGDTLVLTENGVREIQGLVAGNDKVWARDAKTGQMAWKPVIHTSSETYDETVAVEVYDKSTGGRHTIMTNRVHFFYVSTQPESLDQPRPHTNATGKWKKAQDLVTGDLLVTAGGGYADVIDVSIRSEQLQAHNITVQDFSTYFVEGAGGFGASPVWVHNECEKPD